MIGCSSAPTYIKPDFEQKQIKSIAIMPVVDKRDGVANTIQSNKSLSIIEELLTKKIVDKNYDAISPASVKNIVDEKTIMNTKPEKLCSLLKVDGILFSELYGYSDIFLINHSLKMQFKIYDAKGDSLWINDLNDSYLPFLSAIGASVSWAIGISADNKIEPKNKVPIIIAGVVAAEIVYAIVDGLTDETSRSVDGVFHSLPKGKESSNRIVK